MGNSCFSSKNNTNLMTFNDIYQIQSWLGSGKTSTVYLAKNTTEPNQLVAIKIIKQSFMLTQPAFDPNNEIEIHKSISHKSIVKLLGSGHDGQLRKENGLVISGLTFLILEYISGGELFHLCQYTGQMSETKGLMFLSQMINVVQYLHK